MTTFSAEINEEIVIRLKRSARPEITLDLPSAPEPGDKLWVKSMRGTYIVETEKCMILESSRVSRLRPTMRLVLLFGIATNHGHDESATSVTLQGKCKHVPLPEIVRSIRSEQGQQGLLQSRERMIRKLALLDKTGSVASGCVGHTSIPATNDHAVGEVGDHNSGGCYKE